MNTLQIEEWIAIVILVTTVIINYAYLKFKTASFDSESKAMKKLLSELKEFKDANAPLLTHLLKTESVYEKEIKQMQRDIIRLETKMDFQISIKEAQSIFATKDEIRQIESHLKIIEKLIRSNLD